jgi:hypothetical protein
MLQGYAPVQSTIIAQAMILNAFGFGAFLKQPTLKVVFKCLLGLQACQGAYAMFMSFLLFKHFYLFSECPSMETSELFCKWVIQPLTTCPMSTRVLV